MRRIIAFLICLCTVLSVGNTAGADVISMYYYEQLYRNGDMKDGPGSMIGDPNFNSKIEAEDALRVLFFILHGQCHNPVFPTVATTPEEIQYQENLCMRKLEGLSLDYYKRGWHIYNWEEKDWKGEMGIEYINQYIFQSYVRNAYFLGDVSNDCKLGSDDALMILQYVVGKRDSFPRTDYHGEGNFQYMYPVEEWYPTKYFDVRYDRSGKLTHPDAYDDVADIFPDIPPLPAE